MGRVEQYRAEPRRFGESDSYLKNNSRVSRW
jgi:hypothetical protein